MKIESYACGAWVAGSDDGVEVRNAINGDPIGRVSSTGLDFADMLMMQCCTAGVTNRQNLYLASLIRGFGSAVWNCIRILKPQSTP